MIDTLAVSSVNRAGTIRVCDVSGGRTTLTQNCSAIVAYNDEPESSCLAILKDGYLRLGN